MQGIERMTPKEVEDKAAKDFGVCEELLSHSQYLTGSTPTAADCFLFALLDLVRLPFLLFVLVLRLRMFEVYLAHAFTCACGHVSRRNSVQFIRQCSCSEYVPLPSLFHIQL